MKINKGHFTKDGYEKRVTFKNAVLWKTKELSLPQDTMSIIEGRELESIDFIDTAKGETWRFKVNDIIANMSLKTVGQEPQFYFPISLAEVIKHDKTEE